MVSKEVLRWCLWGLLKAYGEINYRCRKSQRGYYWALRAMVNKLGLDWYGEPAQARFTEVGPIQW